MAAVLPDTIDATRCPLCGEQNRCAMEVARETGEPQAPCWCMAADFRNAPLAAVPQENARQGLHLRALRRRHACRILGP